MSKKWYQRRDDELETCPICKNDFELGQMYEYRGALACEDCIEEMREKRDFQRAEVIEEQKFKNRQI